MTSQILQCFQPERETHTALSSRNTLWGFSQDRGSRANSRLLREPLGHGLQPAPAVTCFNSSRIYSL